MSDYRARGCEVVDWLGRVVATCVDERTAELFVSWADLAESEGFGCDHA